MSSPRTPIASRRPFVATLALLLAAAAVPACASNAESAPTAKGGSTDVVAEVGGKPITMAELETSLAPQLEQLDRQRRQLLVDGLDDLVQQKLVEAEAAARGVTVEALFQAEVEAKAGEVTEAEAQAFYEANRARINRPLEQMLPQIKNYLGNQKRAALRDELISGLRAKHTTRLLLEPVRIDVADASAPAKGPQSAPVTIVEFSDFQCPYCSRVNPTIEQALAAYGEHVRIQFRQFPLNIHPQAQKAAEASLCAHDQGKFWELHDAMFADQRGLAVEQLKEKAAGLGLDAAQFASCLDGGKHAAKVADDLADGSAAGVSGTPAMFVNGRFLSGAVPFDQLAKLIDDELARKGVEVKKGG